MADVELVLNAHAELGEGPLWDHREQCLWWVDITRGELHRFEPPIGQDRACHVGKTVSAAGLREGGGLILALEHSLVGFDPATEGLEPLAQIEPDRETTRLNDGKCDPAGRFWIGSMAYDEKSPAGALYMVDAKRQPLQALSDIRIANGPAWSPDGTLMYFADTPTGRVDVFDFDAQAGTARDRRQFVSAAAGGKPDGMTVDAEGCLWVALNGSGCVQRYAPSGRLDRELLLPVSQVSCPTFGGAHLDELYVTTGWNSLDDEQRRQQPHAGALFRAQPGVRGLPAAVFAG